MMSRAFQHEYDHILGRNFTEMASELKLERAFKKAGKKMQEYQRRIKS
jgi:peptide deformylase